MKQTTSAARAHLSGSKSLNLSELCLPTWSNDTLSPFLHDSLAPTRCHGEAVGSISTKPPEASNRLLPSYRNLSCDAILHLSFVNPSAVSTLSERATHYASASVSFSLDWLIVRSIIPTPYSSSSHVAIALSSVLYRNASKATPDIAHIRTH
jgi:hypothetical protein